VSGVLYVVATPIGNLGDISERAVEVLGTVDLLAVEDSRHSARLLQARGIQTPTLALHEHNESHRISHIMALLEQGKSVALISDAGTPLISDPGYGLVRQAHQQGFKVIPVPGACAAIAALSVAGLASDRFCFEGFLPAKSAARLSKLQALQAEPRTLVFYEAPHRIEESLVDMVTVFGADREATMARELTKTYETVAHSRLGSLLNLVREDADQRKGEFVLVVAGCPATVQEVDAGVIKMVSILLEYLPLKEVSAVAAKLTGIPKKQLYQLGLQLQGKKD